MRNTYIYRHNDKQIVTQASKSIIQILTQRIGICWYGNAESNGSPNCKSRCESTVSPILTRIPSSHLISSHILWNQIRSCEHWADTCLKLFPNSALMCMKQAWRKDRTPSCYPWSTGPSPLLALVAPDESVKAAGRSRPYRNRDFLWPYGHKFIFSSLKQC